MQLMAHAAAGYQGALSSACLRNVTAQADALRDHRRVLILGAGTRGQPREDGQLCAARIAERLIVRATARPCARGAGRALERRAARGTPRQRKCRLPSLGQLPISSSSSTTLMICSFAFRLHAAEVVPPEAALVGPKRMMATAHDTRTPGRPAPALRALCGGRCPEPGSGGAFPYTPSQRAGCPGRPSRYLTRLFEWDIQRAEPEATIAFLIGLAAQLGGSPLRLPTGDIASLFVEDHAEQLHATIVSPPNQLVWHAEYYSKRGLYELCTENGLPTAATEFPESAEDVTISRVREFPVMIKEIDPRRLQACSGRRLVLARDAAELNRLYRQLEDPDSPI